MTNLWSTSLRLHHIAGHTHDSLSVINLCLLALPQASNWKSEHSVPIMHKQGQQSCYFAAYLFSYLDSNLQQGGGGLVGAMPVWFITLSLVTNIPPCS